MTPEQQKEIDKRLRIQDPSEEELKALLSDEEIKIYQRQRSEGTIGDVSRQLRESLLEDPNKFHGAN